MRKYEVIFIVRPTVSEEEYKTVCEKFLNVLTSNGANKIDEKDMGQKELAYEINNFKSGFYHYFVVEANNDAAINEFDLQAKNSSDIVRHMITKIED